MKPDELDSTSEEITMKAGRTVLVFDTETTGLGEDDQIIQIAWGFANLEDFHDENVVPSVDVRDQKSFWVRPTIPIKPEATEKHGKTNEDLVDKPRLEEEIDSFLQDLDTTDLVMGYNVSFDIRMLEQELHRIGYHLDLSRIRSIDPCVLWKKEEDRTLETAHKRFVGEDLQGAHEATADINGTVRVLRGMISEFGLSSLDAGGLADYCRGRDVDLAGRLVWGDDNRPTLACTKHKGTAIYDMVSTTAEKSRYSAWYIGANRQEYTIHQHVVDALKMAFSCSDQETFEDEFQEVWGLPPTSEDEEQTTNQNKSGSTYDYCDRCNEPIIWVHDAWGDPEYPMVEEYPQMTCDCYFNEYLDGAIQRGGDVE